MDDQGVNRPAQEDLDPVIAGYSFLAQIGETCPTCRTTVVQRSYRRRFEANDTVVPQGSIYPGLFMLAEGAAKVVVLGRTLGMQAVVEMLTTAADRPGGVYGLASTLTGDATTSSLVTMAPSEFLFIDKDTFQTVLNHHPEIYHEIALQLARETQESRRWLASTL